MIELNWYKNEPYKAEKTTNITENSGVYILSVLLENNSYLPIYIGQADNLKNRLAQHLSDNEENKELKAYLKNNHTFKASYAQVSSKDDRDNIELFLYNKLNPKFNNNTPPGTKELQVSLPDVIKE